MLKLCLAFSALAFGVTMAGGASHAAVRGGVYVATTQQNGGISGIPCKQCAIYRTPNFGDTVTLNPQPLPPRIIAPGRTPRR